MRVGNSLDCLGMQCLVFGRDRLRFPAAEPKPILFVQIADVPHTMPYGPGIVDFMHRVLIGARHVRLANDIPADHQFTDFTFCDRNRLFDGLDRIVRDSYDFPPDT